MLRVVRKLTNKKSAWKKCNHPLVFSYGTYKYTNQVHTNLSARQYSSDHSKKTSGGSGGLLAVGALVLTGGATLAYAKYDPDFKKSLINYVPFLEPILQDSDSSGNIVTEYYKSIKTSIFDLFTGGSQKQPEIVKPRKTGEIITKAPEIQEYKAPPPIVPALEKELKKPDPVYNEIRVEKIEEGKKEPVIELVDVKPAANEKVSTDSRTIAELEGKICVSAEEAVNAYLNAGHIVRQYNQDIEYIVDEAVNKVDPNIWETVKKKTKSKIECVRRAEEKAEAATKDINKLKELISSPSFEASQSTREMIRTNITKVQDDIENAKREFETERKSGNVSEKYWDKVEKARLYFSEELESLFPNIDISKKNLHISEEDLDLFVLHTYAHVLFYQKELAKMETIMQEKIQAAVDAAKRGGGEFLTTAQICEALEQEKRKLNVCFQQQVFKFKREAELELREQLKRQSQAFSDHLEDAIKTREMEIERAYTRKFDEMLEAEKCRFKMQLAAVVGRLKGLDKAIKEKNDADQSSRQAQVLWSACQSLLSAIRSGCPGLPWKEQLRPLEPELNAVKSAAANNDELVDAVLKAIPKEARERGVYPEDALRERFLKVENVARTLALVPEEGAALPIHILSYIQSLLLIKAASPIPQSELNDDKVDFSKLNTNEILQRARYWLDRGDFAQTLRYMNLLKGAPRCVARQWMEETRILLETQQAANTLMAHAASSGLMYL